MVLGEVPAYNPLFSLHTPIHQSKAELSLVDETTVRRRAAGQKASKAIERARLSASFPQETRVLLAFLSLHSHGTLLPS